MSHETIIYGFIEGAVWRPREDYRLYQRKNIEIVSRIEDDGEWPPLTRGIFSSADPDDIRETFRRQVLHFGTSVKEHGPEYTDAWIVKFEDLLAQLYWGSATAHVETETYGVHTYRWQLRDTWRERSGRFLTNYDVEELPPTTNWTRRTFCRGELVHECER